MEQTEKGTKGQVVRYRLLSGNTAYYMPETSVMYARMIVVTDDNRAVGGFLGEAAKRKSLVYDRIATKIQGGRKPVYSKLHYPTLDTLFQTYNTYYQHSAKDKLYLKLSDIRIGNHLARYSTRYTHSRLLYYREAGIISRENYNLLGVSRALREPLLKSAQILFYLLNHVSAFGVENALEYWRDGTSEMVDAETIIFGPTW